MFGHWTDKQKHLELWYVACLRRYKRRDPLVSIPAPMRQYADHDNAKK